MTTLVNSQCRAFQEAIKVLAMPWNALILNVLQARPLRFSELAGAARGPGDKVLSARLKQLEGCGLIVRQVEPGPPVRVTYQLTGHGHGFGEVASAIERWGRCLCSERSAAPRNGPSRGAGVAGRARSGGSPSKGKAH